MIGVVFLTIPVAYFIQCTLVLVSLSVILAPSHNNALLAYHVIADFCSSVVVVVVFVNDDLCSIVVQLISPLFTSECDGLNLLLVFLLVSHVLYQCTCDYTCITQSLFLLSSNFSFGCIRIFLKCMYRFCSDFRQ